MKEQKYRGFNRLELEGACRLIQAIGMHKGVKLPALVTDVAEYAWKRVRYDDITRNGFEGKPVPPFTYKGVLISPWYSQGMPGRSGGWQMRASVDESEAWSYIVPMLSRHTDVLERYNGLIKMQRMKGVIIPPLDTED